MFAPVFAERLSRAGVPCGWAVVAIVSWTAVTTRERRSEARA